MAATAAIAPPRSPPRASSCRVGSLLLPGTQNSTNDAGEQREREVAGQLMTTTGHRAVDPAALVLSVAVLVCPTLHHNSSRIKNVPAWDPSASATRDDWLELVVKIVIRTGPATRSGSPTRPHHHLFPRLRPAWASALTSCC